MILCRRRKFSLIVFDDDVSLFISCLAGCFVENKLFLRTSSGELPFKPEPLLSPGAGRQRMVERVVDQVRTTHMCIARRLRQRGKCLSC